MSVAADAQVDDDDDDVAVDDDDDDGVAARPRKLTIAERTALVRLWYRLDGDVRRIRDEWALAADRPREQRAAPDARTIRATVARFAESGSVRDRARSGRARSVSTPDTIDRVRRSVRDDPMLSTRKRARALAISRSSLMRIQKRELQLRAYKVQTVQTLTPGDPLDRSRFCRRWLELVRRHPAADDPTHRLVMGDEAHFELSGSVFNRQNVRFWGSSNPRLMRERTPQGGERVTVWCGVSTLGVLGPYFFEDEDGSTVSVNGARYRHMLLEYVRPLLRRHPRFRAVRDWWWQQDGATSHTARATLDILTGVFGRDRVISLGAAFPWPARSPDLSAPDYFLWGYLKDRVYSVDGATVAASAVNVVDEANADDDGDDDEAIPRTIRSALRTSEDLKRAIRREIARLNEPAMDGVRRAVMADLTRRAEACLRANGGHLLDVIFATS